MGGRQARVSRRRGQAKLGVGKTVGHVRLGPADLIAFEPLLEFADFVEAFAELYGERLQQQHHVFHLGLRHVDRREIGLAHFHGVALQPRETFPHPGESRLARTFRENLTARQARHVTAFHEKRDDHVEQPRMTLVENRFFLCPCFPVMPPIAGMAAFLSRRRGPDDPAQRIFHAVAVAHPVFALWREQGHRHAGQFRQQFAEPGELRSRREAFEIVVRPDGIHFL